MEEARRGMSKPRSAKRRENEERATRLDGAFRAHAAEELRVVGTLERAVDGTEVAVLRVPDIVAIAVVVARLATEVAFFFGGRKCREAGEQQREPHLFGVPRLRSVWFGFLPAQMLQPTAC